MVVDQLKNFFPQNNSTEKRRGLKANINDIIEIDFVPFGKSTLENANGEWTANCENGPNECYANRLHVSQ